MSDRTSLNLHVRKDVFRPDFLSISGHAESAARIYVKSRNSVGHSVNPQ